MKKFFYDVHVFYSRHDGYSVPVKTDYSMSEDEVIDFAVENNLLTDGDEHHVDYVEEVDEETYKALGGK